MLWNKYSRYRIGRKPQPYMGIVTDQKEYSRYRIGRKPQPLPDKTKKVISIADIELAANRSSEKSGIVLINSIADIELAANRSMLC